MSDDDAKKYCDVIRQCAYDLHVYLGSGYLKHIYVAGLVNRLSKQNLIFEKFSHVTIYDEDGSDLGEHEIDILVEHEVIVELVVAKALESFHSARLFGYMKAAGKRHGVLINFGSDKFEIKKYAR